MIHHPTRIRTEAGGGPPPAGNGSQPVRCCGRCGRMSTSPGCPCGGAR